MLGPLAIDPSVQSLGLGGEAHARGVAARAAVSGHRAVLLVGDAPYYERFGFSTEKTGSLWLPGPYERNRFLARELEAGALDNARGLVSATGALERKPDLGALVAAAAQGALAGLRSAALKLSYPSEGSSARPSDWAARR